MTKVSISASYHENAQAEEIKEKSAGNVYLTVAGGVETLTVTVKDGQMEKISLLGNRIKIKDLGFDENEKLYWLEKTNAPYLTEKGMKANIWCDLKELLPSSNVFKELPDRILDYPAANPTGNRTLDFAVFAPLENGKAFYMRAAQKVDAGVCTFEIRMCGIVSEDEADDLKSAIYAVVGKSDEIAFAGDVDSNQVEVDIDTINIYKK